jgi:hypothetical protein
MSDKGPIVLLATRVVVKNPGARSRDHSVTTWQTILSIDEEALVAFVGRVHAHVTRHIAFLRVHSCLAGKHEDCTK